ncbi:hypothetical protein DM860_014398 [Cuscuta australis]|uniref:PWWP domain-containing protein n=1 Tax=Cuscuta australis TaxID=267555 RepID=A0A328DDV5_9ASTE|nr:hypothetical protein DM860_014398 [Cuscuta australis]
MAMGSSGESGTKSINAPPGGLVWIRRRNGSWWPGRIVGVDDLPENNMITPRSGTPVKLLGREDSSVDWYNLEKSKRVKSFRCGDYDDCIEKAKASTANASRKLVKYARRDDAILQALEIESSYIGKHNPSFISRSGDDKQNKAGAITKKEEDCGSSRSSENNNSSALSQSGVSIEEEPVEDRGQNPKSSKGAQNDSDDESGKHMQGLDDLGTKSFKRKRSAVAHVCKVLKKKGRRRPMMGSTVLVSFPVACEGIPSPSDSAASDVCENGTLIAAGNEILSIPQLPEDGCLDSLSDVPFVEEENHSEGHPEINECREKGTSEWQSKRKRNSRHVNKSKKRYIGKNTNLDGGESYAAKLAECPIDHKSKAVTSVLPTPQRLLPYRQSRFSVNPKYDSSAFPLRHHHISDSSLYDVKVEVKSSYRAQHVPYVSLMTKLNGRPIVGHPITVEVLEDIGSGSGSNHDLDHTGQRSGGFRAPTKDRVSTTKSLKSKKNCQFSKRKIRMLSSLTGSQKQNQGKEVSTSPAKLKGTVVACVSLKVVFSRLSKDLNSPNTSPHPVVSPAIG